jgi:hypothetical protein
LAAAIPRRMAARDGARHLPQHEQSKPDHARGQGDAMPATPGVHTEARGHRNEEPAVIAHAEAPFCNHRAARHPRSTIADPIGP